MNIYSSITNNKEMYHNDLKTVQQGKKKKLGSIK